MGGGGGKWVEVGESGVGGRSWVKVGGDHQPIVACMDLYCCSTH